MARVSESASGSTHADGVRAHQVDLQLADLIAHDVHIAELADASRDRVGNFIIGDERVDDGAGAVDGLARVGVEQHRPFFGGNFTHRLEGEIVSVNVQSFQEQFPVLRFLGSNFHFPCKTTLNGYNVPSSRLSLQLDRRS